MIRAPKNFWTRVDMSAGLDACWPWTKSLNAYGYGNSQIWMDGRWRQASASAVAYWLTTGRWERRKDGRCVRHTCDHRPCCNPRHLIGGTVADNSRDAVERGRMSQGETHCFSKFNAEQIADIREADQNGEAVRSIARHYGVSASTITRIVRGYSWKSEAGGEDRDRARRGSDAPQAKLTEDMVGAIKRRAAAGEGVRALAREFDLAPSTVSRIMSGAIWKHVK